MFSVAVFYAANYFIAKKTVFTHIDPFALVAIRAMAAILVFGSISVFFIKEKIERKDWPRLFACGMFGVAINQTFFLWGLSKTVELNAGVIMTLSPVFVLLLAWILKEEKINTQKTIGLVLAFAGALLLSLGGRSLTFDSTTLLGDGMIALNALSYSFYLVLLRPLSLKYNTMTLVGWIFIIGGIVTIPLGMPYIMEIPFATLPTSAWLGTVYVIIFTTLLTYSLNAWAMKRVPSSQVGIYIYVQPVLVTLIAAIGFRGSINAEKLGYVILVLIGVFFVSFKKGLVRR
jgi:drug/metabolite transporter (DMT)-like permease